MVTSNKSETCIAILFWIIVLLIPIAFILPFVLPVNENLPGPSRGAAVAWYFFGPLILAFWISVAMALFAIIRFNHLDNKYRLLGICPACAAGLCYAILGML